MLHNGNLKIFNILVEVSPEEGGVMDPQEYEQPDAGHYE
jgi:hypothetical protein